MQCDQLEESLSDASFWRRRLANAVDCGKRKGLDMVRWRRIAWIVLVSPVVAGLILYGVIWAAVLVAGLFLYHGVR
jgi:hypothetical protein